MGGRWGQTLLAQGDECPFCERKGLRGFCGTGGEAPGSLLDAASGMPSASTWLWEEVKEKILLQKFPCAMGGWTNGLFGAFGMIFDRRGLAYLGGRYRLRGGADSSQRANGQEGGNCLAGGLAALAFGGVWGRWQCSVADSRGRSRTEHAVARVSAPIKFGTRALLGAVGGL